MYRKIEVRGYAVEEMVNSQWLYGFGVMNIDYVDGKEEWHLHTLNGTYEVVPESIGQYTGLKDKNMKKIYEKDIAKTLKGKNAVICYDTHQAKYKAVPLYLYLSNAGNGGWTGYDLSVVSEVIGNVYSNPELLECFETE